jgi:hypothetical protein
MRYGADEPDTRTASA